MNDTPEHEPSSDEGSSPEIDPQVGAFLDALEYERETTLRDPERELEKICDVFRGTAEKLGREKCVIAVSGGLDSAVVAKAAVRALRPENVTLIYLPNEFTEKKSDECIEALAADLGVEIETDREIIDNICNQIPGYRESADAAKERVAQNPPGSEDPNWVRYLRGEYEGYGQYMTYLYAPVVTRAAMLQLRAHHDDGFVATCPNKTEEDMGLYTQGGPDCGGDVQPLAHLSKTQVRELGHHLQLPEEITGRVPTGDLGPVLADEKSMGAPYSLIDLIIVANEDFGLDRDQIVEALKDEFAARAEQLVETGYTDPQKVVDIVLETSKLAKGPGGTPYKAGK